MRARPCERARSVCVLRVAQRMARASPDATYRQNTWPPRLATPITRRLQRRCIGESDSIVRRCCATSGCDDCMWRELLLQHLQNYEKRHATIPFVYRVARVKPYVACRNLGLLATRESKAVKYIVSSIEKTKHPRQRGRVTCEASEKEGDLFMAPRWDGGGVWFT